MLSKVFADVILGTGTINKSDWVFSLDKMKRDWSMETRRTETSGHLPSVLSPGLEVNWATSTILTANCWPVSLLMHRLTTLKGPLEKTHTASQALVHMEKIADQSNDRASCSTARWQGSAGKRLYIKCTVNLCVCARVSVKLMRQRSETFLLY